MDLSGQQFENEFQQGQPNRPGREFSSQNRATGFACATSSATCHSCVSLNLLLNAGIPDKRMLLAAFQ
jgi:hypothetical protein